MLLYNKDTGIYEYKAEANILELIHQISEFISKNGKSEVVDKIKNATHISEEQLNNPKYLCFENKVLDLTTLEFTDFNSDYLLTRKLPVNYDPNTTCPAIMKFLKEVSLDNQDMIDYLVEIPADCLEPHYHSQKMHMLVGDGSNGKGTYLRLLHKFLGAKNISALAIQQIDQNFMTYRLNYSLANIAGDVSAKYLNFTGTLKKARGEDPFDADRKNKTALSFFNRSKMIFACQEMPQSPDNTKGWYRSWVISNWNAYFSEENKDPELGNKITTSSELSGFLNVVL